MERRGRSDLFEMHRGRTHGGHERQPNQDTHRASPVGSTELGSGSADRQAGRQADGDRASISSALFTR